MEGRKEAEGTGRKRTYDMIGQSPGVLLGNLITCQVWVTRPRPAEELRLCLVCAHMMHFHKQSCVNDHKLTDTQPICQVPLELECWVVSGHKIL